MKNGAGSQQRRRKAFGDWRRNIVPTREPFYERIAGEAVVIVHQPMTVRASLNAMRSSKFTRHIGNRWQGCWFDPYFQCDACVEERRGLADFIAVQIGDDTRSLCDR